MIIDRRILPREVFVRALCVVLALFILCLAVVVSRATEQQVRADCRVDAVRFCLAEVYKCIPETKACHKAVIACMVMHKPNLSADCARHIR